MGKPVEGFSLVHGNAFMISILSCKLSLEKGTMFLFGGIYFGKADEPIDI